ncbi:MAG: peptidylprolyl isomerase [Acidobacteriota bacterium]
MSKFLSRILTASTCSLILALPALAAPAPSPAASPAKPAAPAPAAAHAAPSAMPMAAVADTATFPAVVARVNGREITKSDLLEQAHAILEQNHQQGDAPLAFYQQVLDQMIGIRLLYEESVALGLGAADGDVDKSFEQLRGGFKGDDKAFDELLSARGLTVAKLREGIKENLSIQKLVETKVLPTINISDAEAKKFYDGHQQQMARPEQFKVSHILVAVKKDAPPAEREAAKKKAESLLQQAKGGADFAKLASENSDDPGSKAHGGELPWLGRGQTVPEFEKAALALTKPGELSPVVETQFGFHILKLDEHRPAGTVSFEEAKPRIVASLKRMAEGESLQKRVDGLKAKAKIEILLKGA